MAITEITLVTRPDTSIEFFNKSNDPLRLEAQDLLQTFEDLGQYTITKTLSNDELTQTTTRTFDTLETYSNISTLLSLELKARALEYTQINNFVLPALSYVQQGITTPFTCTTTYTYTDQTPILYEEWPAFIQTLEGSNNLINFTVTETQLVSVHRYQHSEEYTELRWIEPNCVSLNAGQVTRVIEYTLV